MSLFVTIKSKTPFCATANSNHRSTASIVCRFLVEFMCLYLSIACTHLSAQTTVSQEKANNTSTAPTFPGFSDNRNSSLPPAATATGSTILTNPFNIPPHNISKTVGRSSATAYGDVHTLIPNSSGGVPLIFAETQTWFTHCSSPTLWRPDGQALPQCGSHLDVGYSNGVDVPPSTQIRDHDNLAVDDMFDRGIDGFAADMPGGPNDCRTGATPQTTVGLSFTTQCSPQNTGTVVGSVTNMANHIGLHPTMRFFLIEDQSAYSFGNNCGKGSGFGIDTNNGVQEQFATSQPKCVQMKIEADILYFNSTYFGSSGYFKFNGTPVLGFFLSEQLNSGALDFRQCNGSSTACFLQNGQTCGGVDPTGKFSNCWTTIWNSLSSDTGIPLKLVFRNAGGFTHVGPSSGGYAWVNPNGCLGGSVSNNTQLDWTLLDQGGPANCLGTGATAGGNYFDGFYIAAKAAQPTKLVFGIAKKGFDLENAPFGGTPPGAAGGNIVKGANVTGQRCGQVWLDTFAYPYTLHGTQTSPYFVSSTPNVYMLIGTWDDYEEGTEIQTGIDNCVNEGSFALSLPPNSNSLSWSFSFNSSDGNLRTVDHFVLFDSPNPGNSDPTLNVVVPQISTNVCSVNGTTVNCSLPLTSEPAWSAGTHTLYVKAVGKPSITNHLSNNNVAYVPSVITVSPLNFGSEVVNTTTILQSTVTNTGQIPVRISSVSASPSDYQPAQACVGQTLAPGATCSVAVTFRPSTIGSIPGTLTVAHDGATYSSAATLAGTGTPSGSVPVINSLSTGAGPVGTSVTISGTGFGSAQGSSTVTVNGTVAQATWGATSISAPIPLGATSGNVVVTVGGLPSNGVPFTLQEDALHIFGVNCSTCGLQVTDFTIQNSPLYGYVIQSGDVLSFYQSQSSGSVGGITLCFTNVDGTCDDDGSAVDQDGQRINADTLQGVSHFRKVNLTPSAGLTLWQITLDSSGSTQAGRWDVLFSDIQIISADGTVRPIFTTGSTPSLFLFSSAGVSQQGSTIDHVHVW